MHYIDQFQRELEPHSAAGDPSPQHATNLATWLKTRGIQLFRDAFLQETGGTIPNLPDDKLIEQAYPKSLNEIDKKQAQEIFYASNAKIFVKICTWASDVTIGASSDPRSEAFASQHHALLKNICLDALALLSGWAATMQNTPAMYGIAKNSHHDSFQISHATAQLMFGGSPFFAFRDLATDAGTALLRVALETRIRSGFGLLGVVDLQDQTILPLNMSKILKAIKLHESKFNLAIPLQHIERIYGWSNIYVHIGLKHFTWSPIFALDYLTPFLRGGAHPGGHDVRAGIQIDKAVLLDIQNEARSILELDPAKRELVTIPPERCDVLHKS